MAEHKHAEVLRAIADGKEVQWKDSQEVWLDFDSKYQMPNPANEDKRYEWRVKPEPFDWLESQEFYEVCQQYRHAKDGCVGALAPYVGFENLKKFIRKNIEANK